jgi:ribbon-helix-helix protein
MGPVSIRRNMKREPVKRTSIFLTSSQREQLAQRSAETGAPAAELIRRAIDQYLIGGPARARGTRKREAA